MGRYKKLAFAGLLIAGVGFGIGAAFCPPLISLSAACIAGAVSVVQIQFREDRSPDRSHPQRYESDSPPSDSSSENLELNVRIGGLHHHHKPSIKAIDHVDNKSDADHSTTRRKPRNKP